MLMDGVHGIAFVFTGFRMEPDQRLLSHDGQPVPLTPKEYETLLALVEAGGKVVRKEALIARVWPDSYVGDGSLARNISVLRKALGEEVIETLPKVGYRLAVPVTSVQAPSSKLPVEMAGPSDLARGKSRHPSPWLHGSFATSLAFTATLLIAALLLASRFSVSGGTSAHSPVARTSRITSVFIQKTGGLDPLDEGFRIGRPDGNYQHAMRNLKNHGLDRWRLITNDQNGYYRPLSDAEKEFALGRDWKLTCICALEKGAAFAIIDFGKNPGAQRFDIEFLQEGDKYFVALTKRISPAFEWERKIEFPGVADINHPHTYELRYDHLSRTASLWIDGRLTASGYHGHNQFIEDVGLEFGAATYMSNDVSIGVFGTVRFEAY